jgi:hypothetical protein
MLISVKKKPQTLINMWFLLYSLLSSYYIYVLIMQETHYTSENVSLCVKPAPHSNNTMHTIHNVSYNKPHYM